LGDIGHHFPDNDAKWKDADSMSLLAKTLDILKSAGYEPVNIDASVHLETPKLGRQKGEMGAKIADTLKIPRHHVNIKAKTGEGLDSVGKGDAVEAIAIAQVAPIAQQDGA
jgi:2-C-methyl-D-erythritol 2,4-cyclodiphosphate synthase